ncbi:hypothetical protein MIR68_012009 [Amoeboaphelidium protococcarum]|nr:hypothetical protein MIR68_012009 [Amoeboaphelidium protococcarum]
MPRQQRQDPRLEGLAPQLILQLDLKQTLALMFLGVQFRCPRYQVTGSSNDILKQLEKTTMPWCCAQFAALAAKRQGGDFLEVARNTLRLKMEMLGRREALVSGLVVGFLPVKVVFLRLRLVWAADLIDTD